MSMFGPLQDKITRHAEVYIKMLKLTLIDKTSGVLGYFIIAMICMFMVFCIMVLMSLGLVEVFIFMGFCRMASFFITVGIFVLLLLLWVGLRKTITRSLTGMVIKALTAAETDNGSNN